MQRYTTNTFCTNFFSVTALSNTHFLVFITPLTQINNQQHADFQHPQPPRSQSAPSPLPVRSHLVASSTHFSNSPSTRLSPLLSPPPSPLIVHPSSNVPPPPPLPAPPNRTYPIFSKLFFPIFSTEFSTPHSAYLNKKTTSQAVRNEHPKIAF